jgi:hypothetical protein
LVATRRAKALRAIRLSIAVAAARD